MYIYIVFFEVKFKFKSLVLQTCEWKNAQSSGRYPSPLYMILDITRCFRGLKVTSMGSGVPWRITYSCVILEKICKCNVFFFITIKEIRGKVNFHLC